MVDIHVKLSALRADHLRSKVELASLTPALVRAGSLQTALELHEQYQAVIAELLLEKQHYRRGQLRAKVLKAFAAAVPNGLYPRDLRPKFPSIGAQINTLKGLGFLTQLPDKRWTLTDAGKMEVGIS